jgi:glycosyltransferase involved in cell wall biosynthesis
MVRIRQAPSAAIFIPPPHVSMRIAHLPSSYLPEHVGGTEVYVHHLCQALASLGHESAVVWHAAAPAERADDLAEKVFRLPPHPPRRRADLYTRETGSAPPGFLEFLRDWKPDVVHFHAFTLGAGLDHARAAREAGIPYLVTYHTPSMSCPRGTLMRWGTEVCDGRLSPSPCAACALQQRGWPKPAALLAGRSPLPWEWLPDGPLVTRLALPALLEAGQETWKDFMDGAEHIIACADWCKKVLEANGLPPGKITVLRQALPGPTRTRQVRLSLATDRPLRLGFFGRLCWVKGLDLFLEAGSRLVQAGLAVVCEVVGPIPANERTWVDGLMRQHASFASYRGVKHGDELTDWLRTVDVVAISSRCMETGPLTLLEAWDQGVPVVGADLGGIHDFMHEAEQDALLFKPNDADALAATVLKISNLQAPNSVVQIRGLDALAQAMASIYAQSRTGLRPLTKGGPLSLTAQAQ